MRSYLAEFIGTFWLVLGGCGSAVLAAAFPELGIGFTGVSLAFGLTVLTGAYALGPISGGHFNPAVSFGLWAGGRFPASQLLPYVIAQVVGAVVAAAVLFVIASGQAGFRFARKCSSAVGRRRITKGERRKNVNADAAPAAATRVNASRPRRAR